MSIKLEGIQYIYDEGTEMAMAALRQIDLEIKNGEFIGLIGHTGSGKSTLVQHMNGLVKPTAGHIYYDGKDIYADGYDMKKHRSKVGLVFQYPEHQLFEMDVLSDVCFGPKNLGCGKEEAIECAKKALSLVGMDESFYKRSPFDLSGGQKRRVAIAGVLAMNPEMIILDEPTAGLDPMGRKEILGLIKSLRDETGITIVLVSHSMEDVAEYVDRIIVMNKGSIMYDDVPKAVFAHIEELEDMGLAAPQMAYIVRALRAKGFPVETDAITIREATADILKALEAIREDK